MERPNVSQASPDIIEYIEYLEGELLRLQGAKGGRTAEAEPSEPPTTINVIAISRKGLAKRTPRHEYGRQRRSGMGVYDLDVSEPDYPALLAVADEADTLLLFTNLGRAYKLAVSAIAQAEVRDKGQTLSAHIKFQPNEWLVAALPADAGSHVLLVSERGWVQRVASSYFGKSLFPGMSFHNPKQGGMVTAACWSQGDENALIVTRQGQGIRFRETQIPPRNGCLGMRVDEGDATVAVTAVTDDSGVFVLSSDGKGTVRQMSGFRMNKAPGAGGKVVLKTDALVGATAVAAGDDLLIISQSGKMIRFAADEVPPKEGVVQGVNCMGLRNDVATAVAVATLENG